MQSKINPRVGLITVSLDGERIDLAKKFANLAHENLSNNDMTIVADKEIQLNGKDVLRSVKYAREQEVDCIIYLIGTWVYAPDVINAIHRMDTPTIIWGIPEGASFSSVGANVIHGSLEELGLKHKLVYGMPDDIKTVNMIKTYSRAAMVKKILSYMRFGLLGGRSIGMYTATADAIQIKRIFGFEIEHIDQLLMVEYAKQVEDKEATSFYEMLKNDYSKINVPDSVMLKSIKIYFALKKLVKEYRLDFMGVKCLEEVINLYTSCCLAISMCNDEGIVTACQCDINAAIAMKILSILTNHSTMFADVNVVDSNTNTARLINCGTMATSLARMKKEVDWNFQYEYMGKARGACPTFCCKPGPVVLIAFSRIKGEYVLQIVRGEAYSQPKSVFSEVRAIWPQAFIKLECNAEVFYQNLRSNHIVVGYGIVHEELMELCELLEITPIYIN